MTCLLSVVFVSNKQQIHFLSCNLFPVSNAAVVLVLFMFNYALLQEPLVCSTTGIGKEIIKPMFVTVSQMHWPLFLTSSVTRCTVHTYSRQPLLSPYEMTESTVPSRWWYRTCYPCGYGMCLCGRFDNRFETLLAFAVDGRPNSGWAAFDSQLQQMAFPKWRAGSVVNRETTTCLPLQCQADFVR